MTDLSFGSLIAPHAPSIFFQDIWQRQPLWTAAVPAASGLVSLTEVEDLLSSLPSVDRNYLRVVKAGVELRTRQFRTREGLVRLAAIHHAYLAGFTIQLAKIHKRCLPIVRLCRAVETAFLEAGIPLQQRVGAHLHLTPPQGVAKTPHYHTHDNWIVQVRGAKRWRLYGCREEFPLEVQRGEVSRDRLPPLRRTVHLEAGQALYVPRGHYHEAQAVDAPSLHVTLDLTPVSWVDLLCRGARRETALRQALPRRSPPREGESSLKAGWKRRLDGLLRHRGEIDALCRELREGFLESLDPMPGKEGFKH